MSWTISEEDFPSLGGCDAQRVQYSLDSGMVCSPVSLWNTLTFLARAFFFTSKSWYSVSMLEVYQIYQKCQGFLFFLRVFQAFNAA